MRKPRWEGRLMIAGEGPCPDLRREAHSVTRLTAGGLTEGCQLGQSCNNREVAGPQLGQWRRK